MAYVTDSQQNKVMTLDVAAALNGECVVGSVLLPEEIFLTTVPDEFLANGKAERRLLRFLLLDVLSFC